MRYREQVGVGGFDPKPDAKHMGLVLMGSA